MENGRYSDESLLWIQRSPQVDDARDINYFQDNESINNLPSHTKAFFQTLLKSIWTSFTIILATVPLAAFMILVYYLDLNTTNICFEQAQHGHELPRSIMKWVLVGQVVEVMALQLLFQLSLILIFTWRDFQSRNYALLIGFLQGCLISSYKIALFCHNVDFTLDRYRYAGNIVLLLGVIYTGYVVSKKICASRPTEGLKKLHVFKIITAQYFQGCILVLLSWYLTLPWFISFKNETYKAIIAVVLVQAITVPNLLNKKVALSSLKFVKPERNFVFISLFTGVTILLFRIMQAGVKNIEIFTALSLYRGVEQVFLAITEKFRKRISQTVYQYLRICCCRPRTSREKKEKEDDCERLEVNVYIQLMLCQNSALIVSQAYQALYILNNFYTNLWDVLAKHLIRVAIGSGINLFSNSVAIFIQVYWHNSKLPTVWHKAWRLHVCTITLGSVMTIMYFTVVLLTVFQGEQDLPLKNCTEPL